MALPIGRVAAGTSSDIQQDEVLPSLFVGDYAESVTNARRRAELDTVIKGRGVLGDQGETVGERGP